MITFEDDYTKIIFSRTLAHFHHNINKCKLAENGYRTFADYALSFMLMPHIDVHLCITRNAVDDQGIAKEINFRWDHMDEPKLEAELKRVKEPNCDQPYYYNLDLKEFLSGGQMVGALINHGTASEPNWSSHT